MGIEINDRELDLICDGDIPWAIEYVQRRCECPHKEARDAVYAVYHDLLGVENPPKYAGHFDVKDLPFQAGDEVVIPKGTKIRTMHPKYDGWKVVGRNYKVKVHHLCAGIPPARGVHNVYEPQNPTITWPGAGGYWCTVDVNDLLEANGK